MRLLVIRHGETIYNREERLTGQADVPLSLVGEQQAQAVAAYLATEHLDVIVSSDLQRARVTAQAIAQPHGLAVQEDPRLRELSMGKWEGWTKAEIRAREPELFRRWQDVSSTYRPDGGETLLQGQVRVAAALDDWQARYPDSTIVWVAHGGVLGVLICHVLQIDLSHRQQFHFDNVSISELLIRPQRVRVMRLNEISFLSQQQQMAPLHESELLSER